MRCERNGLRAALAAGLLVGALVLAFIGLLAPAGAEPSGASAESTTSPPDEAPDDPTTTSAPSTGPSTGPSTKPTPPATTSPTTGPTPTATPTSTPSEEPPREIDSAIFRWGLNNQTNARSHNPLAINFLSAGVANPGSGGAEVTVRQWKASAGDVAIQKWSGKAWRPATFAGLGTSASGADIGADGPFSNHTVVLKGGRGTLDASARTARISWTGTFTVVYYGGNSIFTVTDPVLRVDNGRGTLTAELGGYAADRSSAKWVKVTPKRVRIATLPDIDLADPNGFNATPGYRGVRVNGTEPQAGEKHFGSFPQPMISFLAAMGGIDQFWYSTGTESYDKQKLPLPITVSYDESRTVEDPTPTEEPSDKPTVTNTLNPPEQPEPSTNPAPDVNRADQPPMPLPVGVPSEAVEQMTPGAAADLQAVSASADAAANDATNPGIWWLAGLLAALAALLFSWPAPRRKSR